MRPVDLSGTANILAHTSLDWFREVPVGACTADGISFELGGPLVLTHGLIEDGRAEFRPGLPRTVSIPLDAHVPFVGFLHTALFAYNAIRWNNVEGFAAEYRVLYDDGSCERVPVVVGVNIRNWRSGASDGLALERPVMFAEGDAALSACCWRNPRPEVRLRALEVRSIEDTTTSIALFSMTLMDVCPWHDRLIGSPQEIQEASRERRIRAWREEAGEQIGPIIAEKGGQREDLAAWPLNRSILKVEDDEELMNAIDLSRPELADVRKASVAGDRVAAGRALAANIRSRRDWLREVPQTKAPDFGYDTSEADALCENRVSMGGWTYDYGDREIDFFTVPGDLSPEPHWYFTHYLQYVGTSLAEAYAATRDEKYAKRLVDYIQDVIRKCPIDDADGVGDNDYHLPAADVDGDGWPDRSGQAQAWDVTTCANRLAIWIRSVALCMESVHVTDEFLLRFLTSVLEQTRHMFTQTEALRNVMTNHSTFLAGKLIECAVCFPEFRCAAAWRRMGTEMLCRFYGPFWDGGMIYPDGSTYESHTGGYGTGMIRELKDPIRMLRMVSEDVPDALNTTLERMYEWILSITTPLRYACPISMVYHDHYGFDVEEVARDAARLTGREDLLYIGTGGAEGVRPEHVSYPHTSRMPCFGGVYAMRSDWAREALYLCAKMGPMHYRHCSNQGHFVIDAYGTELVVGPGYAHEGGSLNGYTDKYMCGDGKSHNTIAVDGLGQKEGTRGKYALRQLDNVWISNDAFDFLEGIFDFRPQGIGVRHTRAILFVKPDYWIVLDRLEGEEGQPHDLRMKYQLHPDVEARAEGNRVIGEHPGTGVSIQVIPGDADLPLEIVKGRETPTAEGWLAVKDQAWPAPALIYRTSAELPRDLHTVFCPAASGSRPSVDLKRTGNRLDVRSRREGTEAWDTFGQMDCDADGFRMSGRLGWVRRGLDGINRAALIDGTSLKAEDGGLDLSLERPGTIHIARDPGGAWIVTADMMNLPGCKVSIDGTALSLDPGMTRSI